MTGPSIKCPNCGRVSYHPKDIEHRFCGVCGWIEGVYAGGPRWYKLGGDDGRTPIPVKSLREWSTWYQTASRRVALTEVNDRVSVSTVFLSLDHRFAGKGPPMLFETMVFVDETPTDCIRSTSWDDAEDMHRLTVARIVRETAGNKQAEFYADLLRDDDDTLS